MNNPLTLVAAVVLSTALIACDSDSDTLLDDSGTQVPGDDNANNSEGDGGNAGGNNGGNADDNANAGGGTSTTPGQPGVSTRAPYPLVAVVRTPTPDLGPPQVPALADPTADAIPSPNPEDPFGFGLEFDGESPVVGGPPTQPKNLRAELISNNWSEINWAPSNDDGTVVQYTVRRDDGVEYIIRADQTDSNSGAQQEIDKYWSTTSFMDCNFTRFDQRVHACGTGNQPIPGTTYIYTVTATDNEGQESPASDPLSITYLLESNAPVPRYDDIHRTSSDDDFAETTDLSAVDYFLDERFQLVFQDEFNGDSVDLEKWQTRLTWGPDTIINDEKQYFVNTQDDPDFGYDPFTFTGDSLIIEAIPTPDELRANLPDVCDTVGDPAVEQCDFLSGALSSYDRFGFLYGYTEGRFKVSGAVGALSSFYLFHRYQGTGTDFHAPEIDIVEYLGENPFGDEFAFHTYHYESPNTPDGAIVRSVPTMFDDNPPTGPYGEDDEFHTFGVLWEPQLVIWYIDGREVRRMSGPQVARRPMNIINYLVTGSSWAPTPDVTNEALFPIQFEVDYIRVYQRDLFAEESSYGVTQ